MRVLITGGSGLIGRALVADLVGGGHEVIVLSRQPEKVAGLPAGARAERWDARSAEGWGALADGAPAIVNLAGENLSSGRWTAERKRSIAESRTNAGRAVVEAVEATARKPRVVVQASAVGYYGPRGDEEISEQASSGDDFMARTTRDWEAATAPVEAQGVRRVVVRSGIVLAAGGGALPRLTLPFRFFVGGPVGSGKQWVPWIHLADEVAAIRFLLEREDASGPFNLAAPNPATNAAMSRAIGKVLGRPARLPVPALALQLVFGELAGVLLSGQRAVPRRLLELGFAFRFPNLEDALRDLLK